MYTTCNEFKRKTEVSNCFYCVEYKKDENPKANFADILEVTIYFGCKWTPIQPEIMILLVSEMNVSIIHCLVCNMVDTLKSRQLNN